MNKNNWTGLVEQWIKFHSEGHFNEANEFYYSDLFDEIIEQFKKKFSFSRENELLISLLGFSPEPIILTAQALLPKMHVVITTENVDSVDILDKYLDTQPLMKKLGDENFMKIYNTLEQIITDNATRNTTIDITGGKKSMVAAASIFARDYGARLVYVDFDEYLKDLRKPYPGTEKLITAYSPEFL